MLPIWEQEVYFRVALSSTRQTQQLTDLKQ